MLNGTVVLHEAYRIRDQIFRRFGSDVWDEKTAGWLIREEAWMAILRDEGRHMSVSFGAKTLLGLPIRVTHNDTPETPMLQVVRTHALATWSGALQKTPQTVGED
jgi:hypothetical protein